MWRSLQLLSVWVGRPIALGLLLPHKESTSTDQAAAWKALHQELYQAPRWVCGLAPPTECCWGSCTADGKTHVCTRGLCTGSTLPCVLDESLQAPDCARAHLCPPPPSQQGRDVAPCHDSRRARDGELVSVLRALGAHTAALRRTHTRACAAARVLTRTIRVPATPFCVSESRAFCRAAQRPCRGARRRQP